MQRIVDRGIEERARAERQRLRWVEAYREFGDAGVVCRRFGVSRPTLRKWLRRHEADGTVGLRDRSRKPANSPRRKVGEAEQALILRLRRERRLGLKRLRNELHRLHGLALSPATVHKVPSRHGVSVLPTRRRRSLKAKRYSRPVPGERVQIDTCEIRPGIYQYTAIDDCSRYLVLGIASRRGAAGTLTFLDQVLEEMPFAIQRIQTDRGPEFFAEVVQRRRMAEAIRFRPIRPRSPHLNGKVERAQRTVLEEFWAAADLKASDIEQQLWHWVHHYNWHRPHESLGGRCPIDRICELADKTSLHGAVSDAYDPDAEYILVRDYAAEMALRTLK